MERGSCHMKRLIPVAIAILLLIIKVIHDTTTLKVKAISIENDKLIEGEKVSILQISDVHSRNLDGKYHHLLELEPDLIVLTGDLIDRRETDLENTRKLLEQLVTLERPIYFVSGNHEHDSLIFHKLRGLLVEFNVIELYNQFELIEVNGVELNLVGVANHSTGYAHLGAAICGVDFDKLTILLSHSPFIPEQTFDLMLSGHTHGGQIRLPLIGAITAPEQGFFPQFDKGLYQLDSGTPLYIDSGLGTSWLPVRLFNEAQVTMVRIVSEGVE